jgi:small subunit ribosomal protein S1
VSDLKILWEDESEDVGFESNDSEQDLTFAEMLGDDVFENDEFELGQKVVGTIVAISFEGQEVTVELGRKVSGVISKQELSDSEGIVKYKVGDSVEAYIAAMQDGEIILSLSMSNSLAREQGIEAALAHKMPVKGKVIGVNKGGFEISVLGKSAFCPVSQIDRKFVNEKEALIGKEFDFLIQRKEGRNLVVSRTALLDRLASGALAELKEAFARDNEALFDGVVEEIKDIGAIIDLNGVSGMVHISQVGYGRLESLHEVMKVGDRIKAKILSIDESGRRPKISLSIKATLENPWDIIEQWFQEGESYTGKVVRLEAFGAFVELRPGIEGLIHISEMSWVQRIRHPKDVLNAGDLVSVGVLSIDTMKRKISLSMKSKEDDPWFDIDKKFEIGQVLDLNIENLKNHGASFKLAEGVEGLLLLQTLKRAFGDSYRSKAKPGHRLEIKIAEIDRPRRQILLTLPQIADDNDDLKEYQEFMARQQIEQAKQVSQRSQGSFGDILQKSMQKS